MKALNIIWKNWSYEWHWYAWGEHKFPTKLHFYLLFYLIKNNTNRRKNFLYYKQFFLPEKKEYYPQSVCIQSSKISIYSPQENCYTVGKWHLIEPVSDPVYMLACSRAQTNLLSGEYIEPERFTGGYYSLTWSCLCSPMRINFCYPMHSYMSLAGLEKYMQELGAINKNFRATWQLI